MGTGENDGSSFPPRHFHKASSVSLHNIHIYWDMRCAAPWISTSLKNAKYNNLTWGYGGEEERGEGNRLGAAGGIMSACLNGSNVSLPQMTQKCLNISCSDMFSSCFTQPQSSVRPALSIHQPILTFNPAVIEVTSHRVLSWYGNFLTSSSLFTHPADPRKKIIHLELQFSKNALSFSSFSALCHLLRIVAHEC